MGRHLEFPPRVNLPVTSAVVPQSRLAREPAAPCLSVAHFGLRVEGLAKGSQRDPALGWRKPWLPSAAGISTMWWLILQSSTWEVETGWLVVKGLP